ncbi:hypothetical protein DXT99_23395 [Pontibacter diazotrophicus]|uniref:Uncharacterized protein n=1 Tax=Pontibacter diazotrophicus TaxID=1400979 RepID=A0A3D8L3G2_9BACT|nr:hypothetical protein [Pontibacter diazotrophicus]RDV11853.1 hypothetical protein DXT99_23395 [Pontibacter diazotrophicus]
MENRQKTGRKPAENRQKTGRKPAENRQKTGVCKLPHSVLDSVLKFRRFKGRLISAQDKGIKNR